jgi:hypothetical protein
MNKDTVINIKHQNNIKVKESYLLFHIVFLAIISFIIFPFIILDFLIGITDNSCSYNEDKLMDIKTWSIIQALFLILHYYLILQFLVFTQNVKLYKILFSFIFVICLGWNIIGSVIFWNLTSGCSTFTYNYISIRLVYNYVLTCLIVFLKFKN